MRLVSPTPLSPSFSLLFSLPIPTSLYLHIILASTMRDIYGRVDTLGLRPVPTCGVTIQIKVHIHK
jgi:hypothetical protein